MMFVPVPDCLLSMSGPAPFIHHFFHANVFHFAVNALALWLILNPKSGMPLWYLLLAYGIGCLSYFVALKPVIGFSNILFALSGLRTPSLKSGWWKQPSTITFLSMMLLMCFLPMFSATTHIASFLIGVIISSNLRYLKQLDNDARRATGNK